MKLFRITIISLLIVVLYTISAFSSTIKAQSSQVDSIAISPKDTMVSVGSSFMFNASAYDSSQNVIDTTFTWSISTDSIGSVDSTGLFTAIGGGEGYVVVGFNSLKDSAHVTVVDTSTGEVINTVTIQKIKQSGLLHPKIDIVQEGSGEYKFIGFPFPLNYLNGGRLQFPIGSLSQDITIIIKLPRFAKIEGDSVLGFGSCDSTKVIVSGGEFIVKVDGDTVSPYYFDAPVSVSLPYKRGLLNKLGMNPEDIMMAFYSDTAGIDTTGITNVVIDSSRNRIIADIAHFSIVVLYGETQTTEIDEPDLTGQIPDKFNLHQNYPNPFNPETKILYHLPKTVRSSIIIYNLLGQEVRTLVDKVHSGGTYEVMWDGINNFGYPAGSGIYIYQLRTEQFVAAKKMILIR